MQNCSYDKITLSDAAAFGMNGSRRPVSIIRAPCCQQGNLLWLGATMACPQRGKAVTMTDVKLDCRGLNCPVPIVRISQAIKKMEASQTLEVEADDPAFGADVDAWVRKMGHELVAFDEGAIQRAVIRKV